MKKPLVEAGPMPDIDMETEGTPPEPVQSSTTGPLDTVDANGERFRSRLRAAFGVLLAVLLMGNILMYSLYKSLQARVQNQERRIERFYGVVDNLLLANGNAEKIEKIEQQVESIDGQMKELTDVIKAQEGGFSQSLPNLAIKSRDPWVHGS